MYFRVLGTIEVECDDGKTIDLAEGQQALLAILLINRGRIVAADELIDQLWPDTPTATARNRLHQGVNQLRKKIEKCGEGSGKDVVERRAPGYRMSTEGHGLDAAAFEQSIAAARSCVGENPNRAIDLLAKALQLWQGLAFGEHRYAAFADLEATRLEALQQAAKEDLIEAELAVGRHREILPDLQELTGSHPEAERLWRMLMIAHYRSDQSAEAVRAYEHMRQHLGAIGIEPSKETKQLVGQILDHSPELEPPTAPVTLRPSHVTLPGTFTSFVGRSMELQTITRLLGDRQLVTLIGVGGVGKTRLAIEAANRLGSTFADGVYFADLAAIDEPSLVDAEVARALGIHDQPNLSARDIVVDNVRRLDGLIVLDNCEHLLTATAEVAQAIRSESNTMRILATSRRPLHLPGEQRVRIGPMATRTDGNGKAQPEAAALFNDRATYVAPELELSFYNDEVSEVIELVDGLPLAIEFAAARLGGMGFPALLDELRKSPHELAADTITTPDRHRTIATMIEWSYQSLDEPSRDLFRALSVFAGTFDRNGAERVGEALALSDTHIIDRLVDASLIEIRRSRDEPSPSRATNHATGSIRYRMLQPVRTFAASLLGEQEEVVRIAHLELVAATVHSLTRRLVTSPDALDALNDEMGNIRAALSYALKRGEARRAIRIATDLDHFWLWTGRTHEGRRWIERALESLSEHDLQSDVAARADDAVRSAEELLLAATAHRSGGFLASVDHDYVVAEAMLTTALRLLHKAQRFVPGIREQDTLHGRAAAVRKSIDVGKAWTVFHRARNLTALHVSAGAEAKDPYLYKAERAYRFACLALERLQRGADLAFMLPFAGWNAAMRGDHGEAAAILERAIKLAEHLDVPRAYAVANRGLLRLRLGDLERAQDDLASAWEALSRFGDLYSLQIVSALRTAAAWLGSDIDDAMVHLRESLHQMSVQGGTEWGALTGGLAVHLLGQTENRDLAFAMQRWLDANSPQWRNVPRMVGVSVERVSADKSVRSSHVAPPSSASAIARSILTALEERDTLRKVVASPT